MLTQTADKIGCMRTSFACGFTSIERRTIFDLWQMSYDARSSVRSLRYASQKWHVPGESSNTEAILFSDLTFEKADADKDLNKLRKRPIVAGKRKFCATPLFARSSCSEKVKKLSDDLFTLGQGSVTATLLKGNNYIPEQNFF